jgi:hypothetical protein
MPIDSTIEKSRTVAHPDVKRSPDLGSRGTVVEIARLRFVKGGVMKAIHRGLSRRLGLGVLLHAAAIAGVSIYTVIYVPEDDMGLGFGLLGLTLLGFPWSLIVVFPVILPPDTSYAITIPSLVGFSVVNLFIHWTWSTKLAAKGR